MHGIKLDYRRFVSARMLDFARAERDAVRKYSDRPVCTNMMGTFDPLDYFKWAGELDFVSVDCYPQWHIQEDDTKMAQWASLYYALTRSLKRMPFLLMESVVSSVNWTPRNIIKRPGMHMLSSLQAIANGADSVQYFQWRASRGSSEKFHGAVISQLNGNNTRVFREVKALGERLEKLAPRVLGTVNRPQAAILYDWENIWAVNDAQALVKPFDFYKRFLTYYGAFWDRGIDTDLIDMELVFGRGKDGVVLTGELSPDTMRLWDSRTHEKLDKDRFRKGLGNVGDAYREMFGRLNIGRV
jgi:beta-galactosidase